MRDVFRDDIGRTGFGGDKREGGDMVGETVSLGLSGLASCKRCRHLVRQGDPVVFAGGPLFDLFGPDRHGRERDCRGVGSGQTAALSGSLGVSHACPALA
jgi:hypothetical protein